MTGSEAAHQLDVRALVCDDDPLIRSVVTDLITSRGGEVIAETDTAVYAIALIDRFEPDVVVLDLALLHGTGTEVIEHLRHRPGSRPRVVVFTAFDSFVDPPGEFVDVVHKPDFDGLARQLANVRQRQVERRRPARVVPPTGPALDDGSDFFRVLADARPGDQLLSLPAAVDELDHVAEVVRRAVRTQDRVLRRSEDVLVLLIDGGSPSVERLRDRLEGAIPAPLARSQSTDVGTDPVQAFSSLTSLAPR